MALNIKVSSSDWIDLRTKGFVSGMYLRNSVGAPIEYSTAATPAAGSSVQGSSAVQVDGTYLWVRGFGDCELYTASEWSAANAKTVPLTATISDGGIGNVAATATAGQVSRAFLPLVEKLTGSAFSGGMPVWRCAGTDDLTYSGGANTPAYRGIDALKADDGYSSSLKVTTPVGTWAEASFPDPDAYFHSGNFALRMFLDPSDIANVYSISIYVGTAGYAKYSTKIFYASELGNGGWITLYVPKDRWVAGAGTLDFKLDKIRAMKVRINANAGVRYSVWLQNMYGGLRHKGVLLITSDDGYASWIKRAIPALDYRGLKCGVGVIAKTVGTGGVFTDLESLLRIVENGHECFTHGTAAIGGAGNLSQWATEDEVFADLVYNRDYLVNNGLSRRDSHLFYAYPQNLYQHSYGDRRIYNAVQRAGLVACRAGGRGSGRIMYSSSLARPFDKFTLPYCGHMGGGASLGGAAAEPANIAAIQTEIQNLGANGSMSVLMFHRVSDDGAQNWTDGLDIGQTDLEAILDTVAAEVSAGRLVNLLPSDIVNFVRGNPFACG